MGLSDEITVPRKTWDQTPMGNPPFKTWNDPLSQCLWAARNASKKWSKAKQANNWKKVNGCMPECLWLVVFASAHQWNETQRIVRRKHNTRPKTVDDWIKQTNEVLRMAYDRARKDLEYGSPNTPVPEWHDIKAKCRGAMDLSYRRLVDSGDLTFPPAKATRIGPEALGKLHTEELSEVKEAEVNYNYMRVKYTDTDDLAVDVGKKRTPTDTKNPRQPLAGLPSAGPSNMPGPQKRSLTPTAQLSSSGLQPLQKRRSAANTPVTSPRAPPVPLPSPHSKTKPLPGRRLK